MQAPGFKRQSVRAKMTFDNKCNFEWDIIVEKISGLEYVRQKNLIMKLEEFKLIVVGY